LLYVCLQKFSVHQAKTLHVHVTSLQILFTELALL
jgi:hypothetical protein